MLVSTLLLWFTTSVSFTSSSLLFIEPPTVPSLQSPFIAVVTSVLHLHPQDALSCVLHPSTVTVLVANPHAKHFAGVIARVTVIGSPTGFLVRLLGFASKLDSDPSTTIVVMALLYSTSLCHATTGRWARSSVGLYIYSPLYYAFRMATSKPAKIVGGNKNEELNTCSCRVLLFRAVLPLDSRRDNQVSRPLSWRSLWKQFISSKMSDTGSR
jgi:hypothetical protein